MEKRKVFYSVLFIILFFNDLSFCQEKKRPSIVKTGSARLDRTLSRIKKMPEVCQMLKTVEQEGAITFEASPVFLSKQFGAFWDPHKRRVCVNVDRTEGELISLIIFELHNALASKKLYYLAVLAFENRISRNNYIEAVERLEYQNSLSASRMVEKGINLKIFPQDARLLTYSSFKEHYRFQKIGGHSGWIGRCYDGLVSKSCRNFY